MPKRSEKRDTAKAEYIAKKKKGEEVSLRALAGELGVSYQTLRNWKAADKWEEALPKKKRGGQPGNQNSKGKRNAAGSHDGAPPGNKNAEKDGAYSTVFFDMLSAEELKITESVPLGGREALEHEMKILKFREHKILAKITPRWLTRSNRRRRCGLPMRSGSVSATLRKWPCPAVSRSPTRPSTISP